MPCRAIMSCSEDWRAPSDIWEFILNNRMHVHHEMECWGRVCIVHSPTDHPMRSWPLHWRSDRAIFERICPHRVGHYDPDQQAYHDEIGESWQSIHGCDGCGH